MWPESSLDYSAVTEWLFSKKIPILLGSPFIGPLFGTVGFSYGFHYLSSLVSPDCLFF